MDILTHVALGGIAGELMLGKKLNKKAIWLGSFASSFPDIDSVASLWMPPADNVLIHRGFTHSILCAVLLSFLFALVLVRIKKNSAINYSIWLGFFSTELFLHLFVDVFNAYGIGWFIPFSDIRISLNSIFVVDPFFSSILLFAFILLLLFNRERKARAKIAWIAIIFSMGYLGYSLFNKLSVNSDVELAFKNHGVNYQRYFTTPTPLNTWLWFVVAEVDSGYQVGYRSVFDETDHLQLTYKPKQEYLLNGIANDHALSKLKQFSQGYYTIELSSDTLVFNDLRFGQIAGWKNQDAPFAFHYYLNYPDENLTVMQRGRFANWNKETIQALTNRIKGNE